MAGNKKPRKPGMRRVHSFTTRGALPIAFGINPDAARELKLMPHQELLELREGRGTLGNWDVVVSRINWASVLAGMVEFSFDPSPIINAGTDAMMAVHKRWKEKERFVFTGDELRAVGEAITLADDMQDATTRRQHRDALMKLLAVRQRKAA
jgi:hypothetical protein